MNLAIFQSESYDLYQYYQDIGIFIKIMKFYTFSHICDIFNRKEIIVPHILVQTQIEKWMPDS